MTYEEATKAVRAALQKETGSDGVVASAAYSERMQLTAKSYGAYVSNEFDDIDDLEGIVAAVVNVVLHSVPVLLKWALCDELAWVSDAGFAGLSFLVGRRTDTFVLGL